MHNACDPWGALPLAHSGSACALGMGPPAQLAALPLTPDCVSGAGSTASPLPHAWSCEIVRNGHSSGEQGGSIWEDGVLEALLQDMAGPLCEDLTRDAAAGASGGACTAAPAAAAAQHVATPLSPSSSSCGGVSWLQQQAAQWPAAGVQQPQQQAGGWALNHTGASPCGWEPSPTFEPVALSPFACSSCGTCATPGSDTEAAAPAAHAFAAAAAAAPTCSHWMVLGTPHTGAGPAAGQHPLAHAASAPVSAGTLSGTASGTRAGCGDGTTNASSGHAGVTPHSGMWPASRCFSAPQQLSCQPGGSGSVPLAACGSSAHSAPHASLQAAVNGAPQPLPPAHLLRLLQLQAAAAAAGNTFQGQQLREQLAVALQRVRAGAAAASGVAPTRQPLRRPGAPLSLKTHAARGRQQLWKGCVFHAQRPREEEPSKRRSAGAAAAAQPATPVLLPMPQRLQGVAAPKAPTMIILAPGAAADFVQQWQLQQHQQQRQQQLQLQQGQLQQQGQQQLQLHLQGQQQLHLQLQGQQQLQFQLQGQYQAR